MVYLTFNHRCYAYKEGQSTINALLNLCETWSENIDNNFQNINMFLDMSSAFDCVSNTTLIEKIRLYEYDNKATDLIVSYLSHRSQYVEVDGQNSEIIWIKHGVPQRSNLGPFLFDIYTQELGAVINENCEHNIVQNINGDLFDQNCDKCGISITFTDDASIVLKTIRGDCIETSKRLDHLLTELKSFLRSNSL